MSTCSHTTTFETLVSFQFARRLQPMTMACKGANMVLLVLLLLPASLAQAQGRATDSGWNLGRVTYYGAPASVAKAYDPTRGEGSFGILAYGSCGYTNLPGGELPFPREQPAATSDVSPDFPGSCGRCYEIRCKTTTVLNNQGTPIKISKASDGQLAFEGDKFRPILEEIDATVKDSKGRSYPGNALRNASEMISQCYNEDEVHLIRITDSCPCTQVLKEGAPGVAAGGETRKQNWCCELTKANNLQHFDISYWAFEQLVHPVYGVAMIEWRPVDCDSRVPLPVSPAYIDKSAIYRGGPRPGWSWFPQQSGAATLITPTEPTPSKTASTCLTMSPGGGLSFRCRECYKEGFQPFAGATAISFWIKSNAPAEDQFASDYPAGTLPALKMLLRKTEGNQYCGSEPLTNSTAPDYTARTAPGGWFRISVPTSAFDCGLPLAQIDQFDLQNQIGKVNPERNAIVCIGDVTIDR